MGPTMDNTTIVPPLIQIYTMGETYESKSEEKTVLVLAILLFVCYFFRSVIKWIDSKERNENENEIGTHHGANSSPILSPRHHELNSFPSTPVGNFELAGKKSSSSVKFTDKGKYKESICI